MLQHEVENPHQGSSQFEELIIDFNLILRSEKCKFEDLLDAYHLIINFAKLEPLSQEQCQCVISTFSDYIEPQLLQMENYPAITEHYRHLFIVLEKQGETVNNQKITIAFMKLKTFYQINIDLSMGLSEFERAEAFLKSVIETAGKYKENEQGYQLVLLSLSCLVHLRLISYPQVDYTIRYRQIAEALQLSCEGLAIARHKQDKDRFSEWITICFSYYLAVNIEPIHIADYGKFTLWEYILKNILSIDEKEIFLQRLCGAADGIIKHAALQYQDQDNIYQCDNFLNQTVEKAKAVYQFVIGLSENEGKLFGKSHAARQSLKKISQLRSCQREKNWKFLHELCREFMPGIQWQKNKIERKRCLESLNKLKDLPMGETYPVVRNFNQQNGEFIHGLFKECLSLIIGCATPEYFSYSKEKGGITAYLSGEYALLGLGSLARNEGCPNSDLEFALLLDKRWFEVKNKICIDAVVRLFELSVMALGETETRYILPTIEFTSSLSKGLRWDDGGNVPLSNINKFKTELFNTLEKLAERFAAVSVSESDDLVLANVIQGAGLLASSSKEGEDLYSRFRKCLAESFNENFAHKSEIALLPRREIFVNLLCSSNRLKSAPPELFSENSECISIKMSLLYHPIFLLNLLDMRAGIHEIHNIKRIEKLKEAQQINKITSELLILYFAFVLRLRVLAHLHYNDEKETVYLNLTSCPQGEMALNDRSRKILLAFRQSLLPVLHQSFVNPELLYTVPADDYQSAIPAILLIAEEYYTLGLWPSALKYYELALSINYQHEDAIIYYKQTVEKIKNEKQIKESLCDTLLAWLSHPELPANLKEVICHYLTIETSKPARPDNTENIKDIENIAWPALYVSLGYQTIPPWNSGLSPSLNQILRLVLMSSSYLTDQPEVWYLLKKLYIQLPTVVFFQRTELLV